MIGGPVVLSDMSRMSCWLCSEGGLALRLPDGLTLL